jgi:hypothetical protein
VSAAKQETSRVKGLTRTSLGWIQPGFRDWLYFLEGNCPKAFECIKNGKPEDGRLFRLVLIVVIMSAIAIGAPTLSVKGLASPLVAFQEQSGPVVKVLLAGAIAAASYALLIARLCGVPISIQNAFFVILFLGLPWVPPTILVRSLVQTQWYYMPHVLILWYVVAVVGLSFNLYRGVASVVTNCPKWRVGLSILVPLVTILVLV